MKGETIIKSREVFRLLRVLDSCPLDVLDKKVTEIFPIFKIKYLEERSLSSYLPFYWSSKGWKTSVIFYTWAITKLRLPTDMILIMLDVLLERGIEDLSEDTKNTEVSSRDCAEITWCRHAYPVRIVREEYPEYPTLY
jgi:hypothetical protein